MNRYSIENSIGRLFDRISDHPIRWAVLVFFAGIVGGGAIFSLLEPAASVADGMWWAFVSMTTVGYGDISPATTGMRLLTIPVIMSGIFSVAILTAALAGRIAQKRIAQEPHEQTEELHDDFGHSISLLRQALECAEAAQQELHRRETNGNYTTTTTQEKETA